MALNSFSHSSTRAALLAGAAVVALAAMPSAANASAYALAETTITDLIIQDTGENGFATFSFSSQASSSIVAGTTTLASANTTSGTPITNKYTNPQNNTGINNCFAGNSSIGSCVSTPGAFSNAGSTHPAPTQTSADLTPFGQGSASYAFATSVVPSTAINKFTSPGVPSGTAGGFLSQIAETNVNGSTGVAQAGAAKQQWTFSADLTAGDVISFNYNVAVDLQTNTSGANAVSALATSQVEYELSFCVTATSCTLLQTSTPKADNQTVSGTATFNPGVVNVNSTTAHSCGKSNCNLTATDGTGLYELTILVIDNVQATATPEPASLGLMGVGLLGVGAAVRRRRSQKKAA